MTVFQFAPATKAQAKARVALEGPSGSGKTWTALSIAQGLGQRIAVIDTERGSASKYAGDYRFDTLQMHTYSPRDLVAALSAAAGAGYDVVIVDSLSHFWMGTGGMLEQVDGFAKRSNSGNTFAAWKDARPMEREMIDGLLAYPGHVIVTMRTKTEWVITENDRGRKEPKKIGLKAEQRDGIEYEFDIVGDLDLDHNLVVSKSRMSALADTVISRPNSDLGGQILAWLSDGDALPTVEDYILRVVHTEDVAEVRAVYSEVSARGMGSAPCMRKGEPTTLRQFIVDRGNELQGPPVSTPVAGAEPSQPASVERSRPDQPQPSDWDAPAPSAENQPLAPHQKQQIMKLLWERCGLKGHDERMARLGVEIGRDLASTNDLSYAEAQQVIRKLESLPVSQLAGASA